MSKTEVNGVRAKLKAHKDANQGERPVPLRRSGVACTVPNFINHGLWMAAQRIAGGDATKAQAAFVAEVVRFEGEKLTLTDLAELVEAGDMMQLVAEVFGRRQDEAETTGNALPAAALQ